MQTKRQIKLQTRRKTSIYSLLVRPQPGARHLLSVLTPIHEIWCSNHFEGTQNVNFRDNWIIRGLESKLRLRPKSPGLRIRPLGSNASPVEMSLMGLLRLA